MDQRNSEIQILVVSAYPIFREGIRKVIGRVQGINVLNDAGDPAAVFELAGKQIFDVALIDSPFLGDLLSLKSVVGLETLFKMVPTLLLNADFEDANILKAMNAGAKGFILKDSSTHLMLEAIRPISCGQYWIGTEAITPSQEAIGRSKQVLLHHLPSGLKGLTYRELEIVSLVVSGYSNREIGEDLLIHVNTVKRHLNNIYDKTGMSNRLELLVFAIRHNLVQNSGIA